MSSTFAVRAAGAALTLLIALPRLNAQTIYALDAAAATVFEFTGPPAGPCAYPAGPIVSVFPTLAPFVCPTAGPTPPPPVGILGDIAVNHVANTIWTTDGILLSEYTPAGVAVRSFVLPPGFIIPGPLTGLGFGAGTL